MEYWGLPCGNWYLQIFTFDCGIALRTLIRWNAFGYNYTDILVLIFIFMAGSLNDVLHTVHCCHQRYDMEIQYSYTKEQDREID